MNLSFLDTRTLFFLYHGRVHFIAKENSDVPCVPRVTVSAILWSSSRGPSHRVSFTHFEGESYGNAILIHNNLSLVSSEVAMIPNTIYPTSLEN